MARRSVMPEASTLAWSKVSGSSSLVSTGPGRYSERERSAPCQMAFKSVPIRGSFPKPLMSAVSVSSDHSARSSLSGDSAHSQGSVGVSGERTAGESDLRNGRRALVGAFAGSDVFSGVLGVTMSSHDGPSVWSLANHGRGVNMSSAEVMLDHTWSIR